ncbi:hypothetical protein [Erysipelatoclostridium sp. An173]|uniref:hypothetical protein n=1 Tax=Erysipelatoclostridium sp. An173 TaxID=1965571 RepID=UPI003209B035
MKLVNRVGLYFIGLFIITIGINLSIISGLGISPVSAFTLPLSEAVNISLGTITIVTYVIFVLIQILVLKKILRKRIYYKHHLVLHLAFLLTSLVKC